MLDSIDDLLTEVAVSLVNSVSRARKVSPHHVALAVPGLCHTHCPDARVMRDCAYCRRKGNVFARDQHHPPQQQQQPRARPDGDVQGAGPPDDA